MRGNKEIALILSATALVAFDQDTTPNRTHWREQQYANVPSYQYRLYAIPTIHGDIRRSIFSHPGAMPYGSWRQEFSLSYRSDAERLLTSSSTRAQTLQMTYRLSLPWNIGWESSLVGSRTKNDDEASYTLGDPETAFAFPLWLRRYTAVAGVLGVAIPVSHYLDLESQDTLISRGGFTGKAGVRWVVGIGQGVVGGSWTATLTPWGHVYRGGREIEALVWSSSVAGFATYRLFPWLRLGVIGLWDYADMESDDDHLVSRDFQHRPEVGPYIEVTPWRGGHLQAFVGRGFGSYHGTSIALGFVLNF